MWHPNNSNRQRTKRRSNGSALQIPIAVVGAVVIVFPFLALLFWSLSRSWYYPALFPPTLDFTAWEQLFTQGSRLFQATLNSTIIAALVTAISVLVSIPAGRGIAFQYKKYGRAIGGVLLFTTILPPIAFGVGILFIFNVLGLTGTITGLILAHIVPTLSFSVLLSTGLFAGYDKTIEDAARTLGASPLRVLFQVTVPAIRPGIGVIALFAFLISWSQYALSLQIGGGRVETLPLLVFAYITGGNPQYGSAAGIVMVVPTLVVLIAAYKSLGRGLAANW